MQTTHISPDPGVHYASSLSAEREQEHSKQKNDKQEQVDVTAIILDLIHSEAELRWRAEQLDEQARELDGGDDESQMQADKLRHKRSEELALADEMNHIAAALKADPARKIPKVKLAALTSQASSMIHESEEEVEASTVVHTNSTEHKATVQHNMVHEQKEQEHKAAEKKVSDTKVMVRKKSGSTTTANKTKKPTVSLNKQPVQQAPIQKPLWMLPVANWGPHLPTNNWTAQSSNQQNITAQPWNLLGLPTYQTPTTYLQSSPTTVFSSQVVAAVKTVTIPQLVGPIVNQPIATSLTPSIFTAPWNQFPAFPTHS